MAYRDINRVTVTIVLLFDMTSNEFGPIIGSLESKAASLKVTAQLGS